MLSCNKISKEDGEGLSKMNTVKLFNAQTSLYAGVFVGVAMLLVGLFEPSNTPPPEPDTLALVNGIPITAQKYGNFLMELSVGEQFELSQEDTEFLIGKMIEEELLVQRGVEVQLFREDARVRGALIDAMINLTTSTERAKPLSERELRAFYADNTDYFASDTLLYVRQLYFTGGGAKERAQSATFRLRAGERFAEVYDALAQPVTTVIPDVPLPERRIVNYLGATIVSNLKQANAGDVFAPEAYANGFRVLVLVDKQTGTAPPFEAMRAQVEAEYARRNAHRKLQDYVDWLKRRAEIRRIGEG